jgi:hypothetical protein
LAPQIEPSLIYSQVFDCGDYPAVSRECWLVRKIAEEIWKASGIGWTIFLVVEFKIKTIPRSQILSTLTYSFIPRSLAFKADRRMDFSF